MPRGETMHFQVSLYIITSAILVSYIIEIDVVNDYHSGYVFNSEVSVIHSNTRVCTCTLTIVIKLFLWLYVHESNLYTAAGEYAHLHKQIPYNYNNVFGTTTFCVPTIAV